MQGNHDTEISNLKAWWYIALSLTYVFIFSELCLWLITAIPIWLKGEENRCLEVSVKDHEEIDRCLKDSPDQHQNDASSIQRCNRTLCWPGKTLKMKK